MQTPLTLRDQIALDLFIRNVNIRSQDSVISGVVGAFKAADEFISCLKRRQSTESKPASIPPTSAEKSNTMPPIVGKYFRTRKEAVVKIVDIIESENVLFRYKGLSDSNLYYYYNEKGVNSDGPAFDLVEECPF